MPREAVRYADMCRESREVMPSHKPRTIAIPCRARGAVRGTSLPCAIPRYGTHRRAAQVQERADLGRAARGCEEREEPRATMPRYHPAGGGAAQKKERNACRATLQEPTTSDAPNQPCYSSISSRRTAAR